MFSSWIWNFWRMDLCWRNRRLWSRAFSFESVDHVQDFTRHYFTLILFYFNLFYSIWNIFHCYTIFYFIRTLFLYVLLYYTIRCWWRNWLRGYRFILLINRGYFRCPICFIYSVCCIWSSFLAYGFVSRFSWTFWGKQREPCPNFGLF